MKIELSHDILAKNIYDRASAEDKMLLKVANFVKGRYQFYLESKSLLTGEDINYVSPYLKKIEMSKEEAAFVMRSKRVRRARWVVFLATGFVVTIIFASLFVWAERSREFAQTQRDRAENQAIELERKEDSLKLKIDELHKKEEERQKAVKKFEETDAALSASREELDKAYKELKMKNEQLEAKQKSLEAALANEQNLRANDKKIQSELKALYGKLEATNAKLEVANAKLAEDEKKAQSRALSARALFVLRQNNNVKLAAQLASESYLLDKTNKEACGVLAELSGKGSDYFQRYAPPGSYEEMIEKLKKNYGKLNETEKNKYLKGMPTEILQNIRSNGR